MEASIESQAEERGRTLYVRLPKTIRDDKQVTSLFPENVKVKLPRQTSRCCHVIFPTIEDKIKCQKKIKNKKVDGKRIVVLPLTEKHLDKRKNTIKRKKEAQKKVNIPLLKKESSIRKLYVSNIPNGTSAQEVKNAFPGCVTLALLKSAKGAQSKAAVIDMGKAEFTNVYLNNKESSAPVIRNSQVKIFPYKKRSKSNKKLFVNLLKRVQELDNIKDEIKEESEEEMKEESEEEIKEESEEESDEESEEESQD